MVVSLSLLQQPQHTADHHLVIRIAFLILLVSLMPLCLSSFWLFVRFKARLPVKELVIKSSWRRLLEGVPSVRKEAPKSQESVKCQPLHFRHVQPCAYLQYWAPQSVPRGCGKVKTIVTTAIVIAPSRHDALWKAHQYLTPLFDIFQAAAIQDRRVTLYHGIWIAICASTGVSSGNGSYEVAMQSLNHSQCCSTKAACCSMKLTTSGRASGAAHPSLYINFMTTKSEGL
jgi:hypothetical protein